MYCILLLAGGWMGQQSIVLCVVLTEGYPKGQSINNVCGRWPRH